MSAVKERVIIPDFSLSPRVDQVGVEERASRFTKRSIKKESKVDGLKLILNMIDLTTLEGKEHLER
jgi:deoxyribose-phosphate aldolase